MSSTRNSDSHLSRKQNYLTHRPETYKSNQTEKRKFYLTTGRAPKEKDLEELNKTILKPFDPPCDFESKDDIKKFWEEEKNKKIKEREAKCTKKHTYRTRLDLFLKRERIFVPDDLTLPGKSITEDIDPEFFHIVSGRPIKEKTDIRQYIKDIRNCFLTRLKIGYYMDEVLFADERHLLEKEQLLKVQKDFSSYLKCFETFLKEDHESSSVLLKTAEEETIKSKNKLQKIIMLKDELKKVKAEILVVEEKWRKSRMFQKFLYIISPSEWRKVHDPYYGGKDIGVLSSDPCLFDSFREFPEGRKMSLEMKISNFKKDVEQSQAPVLYFSDPQQLISILDQLENSNLLAWVHCKKLDFPAEKMVAGLTKSKILLDQDQEALEEEIKYLRNLVEAEEEKCRTKEQKLREIAFGLFRDLITNEEYLSAASFVEDAYEDAVAVNDGNLDLLTMIKEIELKYENLLLALDLQPNDKVVKTTRDFFRKQKRDLKEARKAEKKVHRMEKLLKRLSKSLAPPKKGVKERRMVRRSLPPEEQMFKYKLPKILTKEQRDYQFFFGKPENSKLHKPLCA